MFAEPLGDLGSSRLALTALATMTALAKENAVQERSTGLASAEHSLALTARAPEPAEVDEAPWQLAGAGWSSTWMMDAPEVRAY